VIAARRRELLEETADLAEQASGRRPCVVEADVTSEEDVERMAEEAIRAFGQIDFAINNAAAPGKDLYVWEQTLENWNANLATNLTSQFLVSRACLKHMMPRRRGVILTFSSTAALQPYPRKSHYVASKCGVIAFTRTLAAEVGPHGIRACQLCGAGRDADGFVRRLYGETRQGTRRDGVGGRERDDGSDRPAKGRLARGNLRHGSIPLLERRQWYHRAGDSRLRRSTDRIAARRPAGVPAFYLIISRGFFFAETISANFSLKSL
jgi:NAD(P)-dependent dehydrogenase (short-subunit alcohol dehydrogenase family)